MNLDYYVKTLIEEGFSELEDCLIHSDFCKLSDVYAEYERIGRKEYTGCF